MNPAPPVMRTFIASNSFASYDHPPPTRTRPGARRLRGAPGIRPGKAFLRELLFEIDVPFRISWIFSPRIEPPRGALAMTSATTVDRPAARTPGPPPPHHHRDVSG